MFYCTPTIACFILCGFHIIRTSVRQEYNANLCQFTNWGFIPVLTLIRIICTYHWRTSKSVLFFLTKEQSFFCRNIYLLCKILYRTSAAVPFITELNCHCFIISLDCTCCRICVELKLWDWQFKRLCTYFFKKLNISVNWYRSENSNWRWRKDWRFVSIH